MRDARLENAMYVFNTRGRDINNLHYANKTILIRKNAKDLQALAIRVKENSKNLELKYKEYQANDNRLNNQP